jgi:hypothetical protein
MMVLIPLPKLHDHVSTRRFLRHRRLSLWIGRDNPMLCVAHQALTDEGHAVNAKKNSTTGSESDQGNRGSVWGDLPGPASVVAMTSRRLGVSSPAASRTGYATEQMCEWIRLRSLKISR